ncbi:hypothetical protein Hanom_Chr13g01244881 [Helianthus anomalus]
MYKSLHRFCIGFGIGYVYDRFLFLYQCPLQFQISSCISFCISLVSASIFQYPCNIR